MRILYVTEKLPWPLDSGGNVRSFHVLRGLAAAHDVVVASGIERAADVDGASALRAQCRDLRTVMLEPGSPLRDAAVLASVALSRTPFLVARRHSAALRSLVRQVLREQGPFDAVHFNHLDACLYAGEVPRGVRKVLDAHNVVTNQVGSTLRSERRLARRLVLARDLPRLAAWERDAAGAMDACLVCSEVDRDALRALGVARDGWVVPNGVDTAYFHRGAAPADIAPDASPQLVFVGTLDYDPCEQGVWHFCREILPRVRREVPGCTFAVVGRNPSARLRRLADAEPAVRLLGRVDDVRPTLHASAVAVVPLLAGSGTRLKILEAMAAGVPVVSTSIGAEGIALAPGLDALVADEPAAFAAAVLSLLRDPAGRALLAERGRRLVEGSYSWSAVHARLGAAYASLGAGAGAGDGDGARRAPGTG
jgi:sugar transferase (PEP-CTERM/EpsH1 system associated)